jgi:hypothetical protein
MSSTGADMFTALGEGLGAALGGEGLKAIFAPIFQVVGGALKRFGTAIILQSKAVLALKASFANPTGSLVAGIALVAAGVLLSKAIPKFESGTMTTGPMVGILGDNLSGREYVTPSESIGRLAHEISSHIGSGSGGGPVEVFGRIVADGDQLVTIIDRAERRRGRTY